MVVILEGADLVGKTTLAKALSLRLSIPQTSIWIDLNCPQPAVISVSKTLRMVIQALQPDIIFDRSFLSEWVYSKLKGRDDTYINDLIAEWGKVNNLLLIILYANDDVLKKRFEVRGDSHFSINDILQANILYQGLYNKVNNQITSVLIDVSESTVEQIVDSTVNFIYNKKYQIIEGES
jgi:broad-specificity NMP kinase